MTCGEAYRRIIDEYHEHVPEDEIARHMGASRSYIDSVIGWHRKRGESLFLSTRPYKGHITVPDEDAIWENIRVHEWREQVAAREIEELKRSIREGDIVSAEFEEGKGYVKQIYTKCIKVEYIGRDYLMGKTERGIKETIRLFDLWKANKKGQMKILQSKEDT